jgi:hypothetical protein
MQRRGLGKVYQKTYRDSKGKLRKCETYSYRWNHNGKTYHIHTGSLDKAVADQGLREKLTEIGRGLPPGTAAERLRWADARLLLCSRYKTRGQNLKTLAKNLRHLDLAFAGMRMLQIDALEIARYIEKRKDYGAAEATIDVELAMLKCAFNLCWRMKAGLQRDHVPYIPLFKPNNIRQVSISPAQVAELLAEIPDLDVRDAVEFTSITGWRADSDVLTRRWEHVSFEGDVIELVAGTGKSKKMRLFPIIKGSRVRELLEHRRAITPEGCPLVFHRKGKPIRNYRRLWTNALAVLAERHKDWHVEKWVRHVLRYGAVEEWLASGVNSEAICKIVGMTPEMLTRYHILDREKAQAAGKKYEAHLERRRREGVAGDIERENILAFGKKKA